MKNRPAYANGKRTSAPLGARGIALEILNEVDEGRGFVDELLGKHFSTDLDVREKSLVQELAYGALRQKIWLDWCVQTANSGREVKVPETVRNILRLGAYQVLFCDKIPDHAAVGETVELCRQFGHTKLCGLVNALLRNLFRYGKPFNPPNLKKDFGRHVNVKYSLPRWIVDLMLRTLSGPELLAFAQSSLEPPTLTVRIHPGIIQPQRFEKDCSDNGIEVEAVSWLANAFWIRSKVSVPDLPGFARGGVQVQDLAAQLTVPLLDPQPGETIIEIGSAPGGKTTHISQLLGEDGRLFAVESSENRCRLLRENLTRLKATNVTVILSDATKELSDVPGLVDRVLVDAPCSGLGTLRRRVDLKWRLKPDDLEQLTDLQRRLLLNASLRVKPGGVLVYSTCTLLKEENEGVVQTLLSQGGWRVESAREFLPKEMESAILPSGAFQTLPGRENMDGIFAMRLRRNV